MDLLSLKEFVENFDKENGSDYMVEHDITGTQTGWLIFPTGAKREISPIGVSVAPSQNPFERAKMIAYYWTLKLQLAVSEFQHHKRDLTIQAKSAANGFSSSPPPAEEEIEKLKELKQKVIICKAKLSEAKEAIEANVPEWTKERRRIAEENRLKNQQVLSEISSIEV